MLYKPKSSDEMLKSSAIVGLDCPACGLTLKMTVAVGGKLHGKSATTIRLEEKSRRLVYRDRHKCSKCDKSFRTQPQLRGHFSMKHREVEKVMLSKVLPNQMWL